MLDNPVRWELPLAQKQPRAPYVSCRRANRYRSRRASDLPGLRDRGSGVEGADTGSIASVQCPPHGTYSTGSLNGDGGGNLTEVSTEEGQRRVIEAIKRFTGYSEPDAVGSMTEKVCPENDSAGEGDSMSESYEEGGGSY
jgi:hypothetical protein